MNGESGLVRRIVWRDVFPGLMLFRCFSLSISIPVLFLATLGTLLTPVGWMVSEALFGHPGSDSSALVTFEELSGPSPISLQAVADEDVSEKASLVLSKSVVGVFRQFVDPFAHLVMHRDQLSGWEAGYYLTGGLWNILVWAFVAGGITRIASVRLGRGERIRFGETLRFVGRRYLWYAFAPLFPTVFVVVLCIIPAVTGLLMRWDVGVLIAGVAWGLVLICSFGITLVIIGLTLGWPLLWPAISSEEGSDSYDAFSRANSYAHQRPLHYLVYAVGTILLGAVCFVVVSIIADGAVEIALGSASLGAGGDRVEAVRHFTDASSLAGAGSLLIRLWGLLVRVIAVSFNHAFFWCAATAIYLLLRREVDETEFDEVYIEEEANRLGLDSLVTETEADEDEPPRGE